MGRIERMFQDGEQQHMQNLRDEKGCFFQATEPRPFVRLVHTEVLSPPRRKLLLGLVLCCWSYSPPCPQRLALGLADNRCSTVT